MHGRIHSHSHTHLHAHTHARTHALTLAWKRTHRSYLLFTNWLRFMADGPRNVRLSPEQKVYKPETSLQVTVDCYPPLWRYKWVDTKTNTTLSTGASVTLTAGMAGVVFLNVTLCNTMPIPPVYDICCELALTFRVRCKYCIRTGI